MDEMKNISCIDLIVQYELVAGCGSFVSTSLIGAISSDCDDLCKSSTYTASLVLPANRKGTE